MSTLAQDDDPNSETEKALVLIVDDSAFNIHLLRNDLELEGYRIVTAENGQIALDYVTSDAESPAVILLDRMMPVMDGMTFISKIKSMEQYKSIPIIMQTAAAQNHQIEEGINAGVYYYLTKPYDVKVLLSVTAAAVRDYGEISRLRKDLNEFSSKLGLIRHAELEFKDLDQARYLSTFLSHFFPKPDLVVLGLFELLTNAVEHGNLGITYDEKTELNIRNQWKNEVHKRLQMPEYKDRTAKVTFNRHRDRVELIITDEGDGFDYHKYLELSPDRALDNHGRGIAMSKMLSFDELEYKGKGNEVVCTVYNNHE